MKIILVKIVRREDNNGFKTDMGIFFKRHDILHTPQKDMLIALKDKSFPYFRVDQITETVYKDLVLFNIHDIFYRNVDEKYPQIEKGLKQDNWKSINRKEMFKQGFLTTY